MRKKLKKWPRPKLIILLRSDKPGERVLMACKSLDWNNLHQGPDDDHSGCSGIQFHSCDLVQCDVITQS